MSADRKMRLEVGRKAVVWQDLPSIPEKRDRKAWSGFFFETCRSIYCNVLTHRKNGKTKSQKASHR